MRLKLHMFRGLALAAGMWTLLAPAQARPAGVEWFGGQRLAPLAAPRQYAAALPPEQRQQMRQQMRQHWQQMPPEQRDWRRQESQRWPQQVPFDERQRMREEMREQRGGGRGGRPYRW